MESMTNELVKKADRSCHDFKGTVKYAGNKVEKIWRGTGAVISKLADATSKSMGTSRKYLIENPAKGVALAAATGVVVGGLLILAARSWRHDRD